MVLTSTRAPAFRPIHLVTPPRLPLHLLRQMRVTVKEVEELRGGGSAGPLVCTQRFSFIRLCDSAKVYRFVAVSIAVCLSAYIPYSPFAHVLHW